MTGIILLLIYVYVESSGLTETPLNEKTRFQISIFKSFSFSSTVLVLKCDLRLEMYLNIWTDRIWHESRDKYTI